ncbi:arrestin domain-containing protein 3-like isoform X2 [Tubulanus polymorphus]|uniref:arrestin domain-containing protein 3-like isoform X1 n=1 Tax=Tubulanus polymorphus TaxID=672921 RepID=UPI003DA44629
MGKLSDIRFAFERPSACYYPGDEVTASLTLVPDGQVKIKSVTVEFRGSAATRWRSGLLGRASEQLLFHDVQELPVRCSNHEDGDEHETLTEKCEYDRKVSFSLPVSLPPSFVDVPAAWCSSTPTAQIDYCVYVKVQYFGFSFSDSREYKFNVHPVLDLNTQPLSKQRAIDERELVLCGVSGFIEITAILEKRGYVPGEQIKFQFTLENKSDTKIKNLTVRLKQLRRYYADTWFDEEKACLEQEDSIQSVDRGGIAAGTTDSWDGSIDIPQDTMPSIFQQKCWNVFIDYYVQLGIELGGVGGWMAGRQELGVWILVGTNPLKMDTTASEC